MIIIFSSVCHWNKKLMVFSDVSLWHCSLFLKLNKALKSHVFVHCCSFSFSQRQPRAFFAWKTSRYHAEVNVMASVHLDPVLLFLQLRIYLNPLTFVLNFLIKFFCPVVQQPETASELKRSAQQHISSSCTHWFSHFFGGKNSDHAYWRIEEYSMEL